MWGSIARILGIASTAATGYWLNDFGSWLAGVTGTDSKVRTPSGGFKWWFVVLVGLILAGIAYLLIQGVSQFIPKRYRK